MRNQEYYEQKLEVLETIAAGQLKTPHHIPVEVYIQEANELYLWALPDKEALRAVGLAPEILQDLPCRSGALIHAEAIWQTQRETNNKKSREWKKLSHSAKDLRNRLLADFRFAFRKHAVLLKTVREIAKGETHPDTIQDLNDLGVLGNKNRQLLETINFDMSLLEKAVQTAAAVAKLLAETTTLAREPDRAKKIRDQAYTHLKEAVDDIRRAGQYVFRQNKGRLIGYKSRFIGQLNSKRRRKPQKN